MNKIIKIKKSFIKGLQERNGSYFLEKRINGERLYQALARIDEVSREEAEQLATDAILIEFL